MTFDEPYPPAPAAAATSRISGFLNGTHYQLGARDSASFTPTRVIEDVRAVDAPVTAAHAAIALGGATWAPKAEPERQLRRELARALAVEGVCDLFVFGSVAREATTGFSDLDAILVIADDHASDESRLRRLRRRTLAAGRSVLAYQPMQHHGFLVTTPDLLAHPDALGLPPEALRMTASLFGESIDTSAGRPDPGSAFRRHAAVLQAVTAWPRHEWAVHRLVAEFELAPALYLQATGRLSAKHESFAIARGDFGDIWAPYDVLERVRRVWPRRRELGLQGLARVLRNPWAAVAVRRRLPAPRSRAVSSLLDERCLVELQLLVRRMSERVG